MGEMIYHGKVKQVWSTDDPDIIEFRYTDQISVFDQIIPSLVPRKGESLNPTSCHWFELVEKEGVCDTHVIEMNAPDRVRARRFDVIREAGAITPDAENVFVPLEVICRHYLAGSGWRRYARGDVGAEEFGFEPGTVLTEGVKLPKPYLEVSTKFEKFDRLLGREEALEISNLSDEEFDSILEIVLKVDEIIERLVTYPIESAMAGLPGVKLIMSNSIFGLSYVSIFFEDKYDIYFLRQLVSERLATVDIPKGFGKPVMGPMTYWKGLKYSMNLKRPWKAWTW